MVVSADFEITVSPTVDVPEIGDVGYTVKVSGAAVCVKGTIESVKELGSLCE